MNSRIIDGNKLATKVLDNLKCRIKADNLSPSLEIIQTGDDFASNIYVEKKVKAAETIGIEATLHKFISPDQEVILKLIDSLNENPSVHGIMVQLPLSKGLDATKIIERITPEKDVDGLTATNLGKIWHKDSSSLLSATPRAIIECIKIACIYKDDKYSVDELHKKTVERNLQEFLKGKHVVIINDSIIVGRPLGALVLNYGATVTFCNIHTKDLGHHTRQADILISATGRPNLIDAEKVKDSAIVIDVGINKTAEGVSGDIDFESVSKIASWITPVPGGVGPLTIAMLMENTYKVAKDTL